jgi:hypothetical protein
MQSLIQGLHALPLPAMLLVTFLIALGAAALIVLCVRVTLRLYGYGKGKPFALRDVVVTATSAMFALMIAFSAAGIWSEANQARTAVQREANGLETLLGVAASFPPALQERVTADVMTYATRVLEIDWPAMLRKVRFTDNIYDESEKILIDLVATIARDTSAPGMAALGSTAIGQLVEVRSARLQRITLATQGVSPAQWLAMLLIATSAAIALAMIHNHDPLAQLFAVAIYAVVASAAFFVILAHDRPFVGQISVGAQPIEQVLGRLQ